MMTHPCVDCGHNIPLTSVRCWRCEDAHNTPSVAHLLVVVLSLAITIVGLTLLYVGY
jgi:hypothetical protein